MKRHLRNLLTFCMLTAACGSVVNPAHAQVRIGDICTVQGHAEQTLHGMGLVIGLDGTGDPDKYLPTQYALSTAMRMMGTDVGGIEALKGSRNAALVLVEATLPPDGISAGETVDCRVTAFGATKKSLAGGYLLSTPLISSIPVAEGEAPGVYAFAAGALTVQEGNTLAATIANGCQMHIDVFTQFQENGLITLNIDPKHSEWGISTEVAEAINALFVTASGPYRQIASAPRQRQVIVQIPEHHRNSVPRFIGEIMQAPLAAMPKASRVVVDERSGTVVIDPDVEIDATVFSVPGINVQIGGGGGNFSALDPLAGIDDPDQFRTAKLQALVDALNAINVPPDQVIAIIRTLDAGGRIHGHVEYIQ